MDNDWTANPRSPADRATDPGKQQGSEDMDDLASLVRSGPPKLDDSDGKWLVSFFKILFYVCLISGGSWFLFKWNERSIQTQEYVAEIRQNGVTRSQLERFIREENRQHSRLWRALHRPQDAEDIEP